MDKDKTIEKGARRNGMNPIDFISALDGKILLHTEDEIVKRSANMDELADVFVKHGTKNCFISSSVEFSNENGFPDNDAMDIVEKAIDKAKEKQAN